MASTLYIAGVDYEPVNTRLTFSESVRGHNVEIVTIDDNAFESEGNAERICLRFTNLTEPCLNSVTIGDDDEVLIAEDDRKIAMYFNISLCIIRFIFIQLQCLYYHVILIQLVILLRDGLSAYSILLLQSFFLSFNVL